MLNVTRIHRETWLISCYQKLQKWMPEIEEWLGQAEKDQIMAVVNEVRFIFILRFEYGSVIA